MKIEQLLEHKKGIKAVKYTSKPRDPNTKTMQGIRTSGAAGAHRDKKKEQKQGYEKHKSKELAEGIGYNPERDAEREWNRYEQGEKEFRNRERNAGLEDEDRGMYFVVIAKNGKWEYTKAQPRQEGMNAAQRIINSLHAKYPSMHLGMMGPDGKVYNMGKGK